MSGLRESAGGLWTGFSARRLRKNKAWDSRPESPSNPGIDRGDSRPADCQADSHDGSCPYSCIDGCGSRQHALPVVVSV